MGKDDILQTLGVAGTTDNLEVVHKSDVVFIATKPTVVNKVASEIAATLTKEQLVVSIAMGVTIRNIESVRIFDFFLR
ncbi:unnamed protein product [Gongylonema pulchrum]|uniref:F420_oxidored domain-containing protein n=1 Tax=Gongylonema pulchrum TaxID=637853 RepID=A0A183F1R3_9BILA|nr:unnamed protein product [Gongylonema pulchrum]